MKFDREAPGGGVEIYCGLQMGKAVLEWKFYCLDSEPGAYIKLFVKDREGNLVLEGRQLLAEEELLKTILLHPRLWNGVKDPYLYTAEIFLTAKGAAADSAAEGLIHDNIVIKFPLRRLQEIPGKGWMLNGELFFRKAVRYCGEICKGMLCDSSVIYACCKSDAGICEMMNGNEVADCRMILRRDLQFLLQAGVNTLCIGSLSEQPRTFYEVCEELGFVIWAGAEASFAPDGRLFWREGRPSELFYKYKAQWSEEPFVYLSSDSLKRQENGNYSITVYSNQKKTALYVDGRLFEFQSGEGEFHFREIPFHNLFLNLTAEAGECTMSLTLHRIFTFAENH